MTPRTFWSRFQRLAGEDAEDDCEGRGRAPGTPTGGMREMQRPTKNQKNQIHKRGRKRLDRVLARDGYECHWCRCPLIRPSMKLSIIRRNGDWAYWTDGDTERKGWWATVDHLTPVCIGGQSTMENMVAACGPCNRRRGAVNKNPKPDVAKWRGNPVCKCGTPKRLNERRCEPCRETSKVICRFTTDYLVSSEPGHCRRCLTALIPHGEAGGMFFYRCPSCVKRPRGRMDRHPASIGDHAGSSPAGVTTKEPSS